MSKSYLDIKKTCKYCNKQFTIRIINYPCNCDVKRESYITCPHCNKVTENIRLDKNQDIIEIKVDN